MSENKQNTDSSRAIIRLLTALVAILGLLLVTFVIVTGILAYAYINANGSNAVAKTEPATTFLSTPDVASAQSPAESKTEPAQPQPSVGVVASEPAAELESHRRTLPLRQYPANRPGDTN